jgi:hypothetical protein
LQAIAPVVKEDDDDEDENQLKLDVEINNPRCSETSDRRMEEEVKEQEEELPKRNPRCR